MKIIDRYILGSFLRLFLGGLAILVTLFIVIVFFGDVEDFVNNKATFAQIASYLLFRLPEAFLHMTPMAVLIASILTFTLMSRNREVVILMSSGLSAIRVAAPVLAAALLISFLTFLDNEYFMPFSWKQHKKIWRQDIKKIKDVSSDKRNMVWLKTDSGEIWNIAFMDVKEAVLFDVTVLKFTPERSGFASITKAKSAYMKNGVWIFNNGFERTFGNDGSFDENYFEKKEYGSSVDFNELKQVEKKPQEMNLREIGEYAKRIRKAGYDDTRYMVDLYVKIFFPMISLLMALIAVPFSLKPDKTAGVLAGVTISVLIGFLFWFIFSMSVSLGYSGKLPPLLAAGGAHMLFFLIAMYAMVSRHYMRDGFFGRI